MRVPNPATLWSYGKGPAIALLQAMIAERREDASRFLRSYPRDDGTHEQKIAHSLESERRLDLIGRLERRLREVQQWPDAQ